MVRVEQLDILLHNSHYQAGDKVTGIVRMDIKKPIVIESLIISLKCEGHTNWLNKTSEQALEYRKQYATSSVDITDPSKSVVTGKYEKNFEVMLPTNLPSSYIGEYGSIMYACCAKLIFHKDTDSEEREKKSEANLNVVALVDKHRFPQLMKSVEFQDAENVQNCCLKSGAIAASIQLNHTVFCYGDTIAIDGRVENNTSAKVVRSVKAKLMQTITFVGESEFQHYTETKILSFLVASLEKGAVTPRENQEWNHSKDFLQLNNKAILPTQTGFLIDISYKLVFDVDNGPMIEIPIVIASKL